MKFSKQLVYNAVAEWRQHYMDYGELKKYVSRLGRLRQSVLNAGGGDVAKMPPGDSGGADGSGDHDRARQQRGDHADSEPEEDEEREVQRLHEAAVSSSLSSPAVAEPPRRGGSKADELAQLEEGRRVPSRAAASQRARPSQDASDESDDDDDDDEEEEEEDVDDGTRKRDEERGDGAGAQWRSRDTAPASTTVEPARSRIGGVQPRGADAPDNEARRHADACSAQRAVAPRASHETTTTTTLAAAEQSGVRLPPALRKTASANVLYELEHGSPRHTPEQYYSKQQQQQQQQQRAGQSERASAPSSGTRGESAHRDEQQSSSRQQGVAGSDDDNGDYRHRHRRPPPPPRPHRRPAARTSCASAEQRTAVQPVPPVSPSSTSAAAAAAAAVPRSEALGGTTTAAVARSAAECGSASSSAQRRHADAGASNGGGGNSGTAPLLLVTDMFRGMKTALTLLRWRFRRQQRRALAPNGESAPLLGAAPSDQRYASTVTPPISSSTTIATITTAAGGALSPSDPTSLPDAPPVAQAYRLGHERIEARRRAFWRLERKFFERLHVEATKVDHFYTHMERELTRITRGLAYDAEEARRNADRARLNALRLRYHEHYLELAELINFVELNCTGFEKILKKHDKVTDLATKAVFMRDTLPRRAFCRAQHSLSASS